VTVRPGFPRRRKPRPRFLLALFVVLAGCAAASTASRVLVTHDFDASAQGWLVAGDSGTVEPGFQPDGGKSGGYIYGDDEALGETWYFRAPDSVLAQLAAADGGSLGYSLKQSSTDAGFLEDDIIIEGAAGRLSYRFRAAPGTDWTDFSVTLTAAAGWRWNWNAPATEEQIRSVLVSPTRLDIRGEFRTGPDIGGLDDFVLTARGLAALDRVAPGYLMYHPAGHPISQQSARQKEEARERLLPGAGRGAYTANHPATRGGHDRSGDAR
jgi:hypothetical protein